MSAQVESMSLFEVSNHVLDPSDLVDLVSGATLRNSPPSRMVTSSPILSTSSNQCLTRPSSPTLDSTFSILGDQDHVVSQITLINGEKIWVREDKGPSWNLNPSTSGSSCGSSDDCNSSTDSINICVPLFVSTTNQVSELDLSSEMLDLTALLSSATPTSQLSQITNCDTVQVIPSKPPQPTLVSRDRGSPDLPKPGNSLLRSALTGKTSYLMTKSAAAAQQNNKPTLPTFKPGSESSQIGEQKVEEILLLAKKRSLENGSASLSMTPIHTNTAPVQASTVLTSSGDKLVINNLLNTAATQLNLAPPSLSSLVPVRTSGDTNNNIKSIPPPSVISLVVDVGNNNNPVTLPPNLTPTFEEDTVGGKKRMLKRQKSNSSSTVPSFLQAEASPGSVGGSASNEPRKEARLLHYCPICNKGFKDRYSVNVHVRTHTGEKPFSCALCGKCFRQKAHLAKHHQTHAAKQTGLLPQTKQNETPKQTVTNTNSANSVAVSSAVSTTATLVTASGDSNTVTVGATVAGNSNVDKIVFPLSPVNVEIMEQT